MSKQRHQSSPRKSLEGLEVEMRLCGERFPGFQIKGRLLEEIRRVLGLSPDSETYADDISGVLVWLQRAQGAFFRNCLDGHFEPRLETADLDEDLQGRVREAMKMIRILLSSGNGIRLDKAGELYRNCQEALGEAENNQGARNLDQERKDCASMASRMGRQLGFV